MTAIPKIAIVGRPNVGKSALFNALCKKRIAIVDEAEGITRDRLYCETDIFGKACELIDTGGIDPRSKAPFNEQVKRQAEIAIEEADSIIMVVDVQVGITTLDMELARKLLTTHKPLCLAVNKIDNPAQEWEMHSFQELGISKIVAVSASQTWHMAELLETAIEGIPLQTQKEESLPGIKVAIVGRPNVGKSSLLNYLMGEERCIVSPIPGTTRDSIDIPCTYKDQLYTFIDTAGIRRKTAEKEVVDKFAYIRTTRAIERADLCLLMIDAQQGMTTQEKRIANEIEQMGKGCLVILNKWDLVKGFRMEHCFKSLEEDVPFLKHCPKLFMSAKTGRNVEKIFPHIQEIYESSKRRITTHQLNKFLTTAMQRTHPPMISGKRLRVYYMAQVGIEPPVFILFVNHPQLMTDAYKKYLYNQFREEYGYIGCPLRFYLKGKKRDEQRENRLESIEHDKHEKHHKHRAHEETSEFDEEDFDPRQELEDFELNEGDMQTDSSWYT